MSSNMWPSLQRTPDDAMIHLVEENHTLRLQVNHLNGQVYTLSGQVNHLQAENMHLRALLPPPPPPTNQVYTAPSDNALHLPVVVESLAVMRDHFQRQGTLRQCSHPRCSQYAFEQICFREGHMAWCRTHNRIITGNYTSCSVKAEERGDCVPVWWEFRNDWSEIVDHAYREGRIGHKGLKPAVLHALLHSPVYNPPRAGPQASIPQGIYPRGNWL